MGSRGTISSHFPQSSFRGGKENAARGTDVTGNQTSLLPRRPCDFILSGQMEPQTNRFCLAIATAPQVSLRGICRSWARLSVKHWPIQLGLRLKKKKNRLEKIFGSKTFGPLPGCSRGGGGVSHRRGSYEMLSVRQLDHDCTGCFTSPPYINVSQILSQILPQILSNSYKH